MAKPSSVNILQVCKVAPPPETTTSTSAPATSLPLTFFDVLWLRFPPVERLFFYEFPHSPSSFFDSVLPRLKHSLSLTLSYFLPLAGNITWPHDSPTPIITYVAGDAVTLTVAESDADFNHLSGSDFSEAEESQPLLPRLTVSDEQASVMDLQITLFPNFGFSIGITTHHAALDGKSSASFLKSWAYFCSKLGESSFDSSLPENLIPFFDRSVIKDPNGIAEIFANYYLKKGGPNNRSLMLWDLKIDQEKPIRGTFELTPSNIQKLKKYAESKLNNKKVHLSTFSVTCAHALDCLVKAEQTKEDKALFIFSVDCRSRLDPPIPPTYFGNCIAGFKSVAETKSLLGNDGFVAALEALSETLRKMEDGVLGGAERWISDMETFATDRSRRKFTTAGSPRFEVYSNDFGWGRPKKVDMASIAKTGAFSLSESRNGNGGIEIGMVLDKPIMEAFAALFHKGL